MGECMVSDIEWVFLIENRSFEIHQRFFIQNDVLLFDMSFENVLFFVETSQANMDGVTC